MQLHQRDAFALLLAFLPILATGLARPGFAGLVILAGGAGVGVVLGVAVQRGWMGASWKDAGVVVGAAVAIALMSGAANNLFLFGLPAVGALPLAHLLAERHPEPERRGWLFLAAVGVATLAVLFSVQPILQFGGGPETRLLPALLASFVALIPALGLALAPGTSETVSTAADRWTALALGVTPGAAMTVMVRWTPDPILFAGWLVILVLWRRFGSGQLERVGHRTEQQRDLAVAAAEAERARLAADLHDDALQELTGLVRRFDEAGDAEGAELARGVAERLRAICSDLRLPLLDDLGAGPAIEWLVTRIQPLADGPVILERSDVKRPPPAVELAVFRVAQEALANAVRHGKTPITVRFRANDEAVSLTIDDAGTGIPPRAAEEALQSGHFGLANMQQRAEQIGALLDVRSWPGGGTHVALEWRAR